MLTSIKPDLDALGIHLVAVGSGTPLMAKSFQQEFGFSGDIYVDQKREIYNTLGCNRGVKYVLNGKALKSIQAAMADGFSQGKTAGDSLQLGGTFVISAKGGILFQHLEAFAGDHVDLTELLSACKQIASGEYEASASEF